MKFSRDFYLAELNPFVVGKNRKWLNLKTVWFADQPYNVDTGVKDYGKSLA